MRVRAGDNKDRWIATADLASAKLQSRHPARRRLDQLELQRVRLDARQPHAVAAVRAVGLLAPVPGRRGRQGARADLGQVGSVAAGAVAGWAHLPLRLLPRMAWRLRSLRGAGRWGLRERGYPPRPRRRL